MNDEVTNSPSNDTITSSDKPINLDNAGQEEVMLTTTDNPFNPFTQFEAWFNFDSRKGYNTCPYLARVAHVSDELSETDYSLAVLDAIDEIIKMNLTNNYIKVTPTTFVDRTKDK
jgi:hypothetical protein